MSQQPPPPWQTMPKSEPPVGYRPLLQQPFGRSPNSPQQPRPPKKKLPPIAWVGIGIGVVFVVLVSSISSNNSGNKAVTATPRSTTAARAATAPPSLQASTVVATATQGATPTPGVTPTQGALPTPGTAAPIPPSASPVSAVAAQVVTIKDISVNVRQSPDPNAPVIATLDPATDAAVLGPDTTGPDGATRWVHVQAGAKEGYVRSDLVSAPHAVAAIPSVVPTATATASGAAQAATVSTPQQTKTQDDREAGWIAQGIDTWRSLNPDGKTAYAQALIDQYPDTPRHPTTAQVVTAIDLYGKEFPNRHEDYTDLATIYLGYADGTTVGDFVNMQESDARITYAQAIGAIDALPCGSRWDEMQAFAKTAILKNAAVSVESFGIFYRDELRRQTGNFSAACRDINQRTP